MSFKRIPENELKEKKKRIEEKLKEKEKTWKESK